MKYLQRFILILLSYFSLFMFFNAELAHSSFSAYENQISEESSDIKVKKLQEVFSGLGLYNGVIDGKYESIKESLLSYQKRAGIIIEDDDHGAGYFGNKTIDALEKEYGDRFLKLKEIHLKIDEPSKDERYFIVTAYYSPLPGQERYSYKPSEKRYRTYEEEIRLQGKGTNGASGKEVFAGMIAAPRNYSFGTKIYLEGVGIGSVEDRGGAIVNSGERSKCIYDCIDIWVGYGDEGRIRAEQWGKKTVKGFIVDNNENITIKFNESPATKYRGLVVDAKDPKEDNVKKLQELLKETGLYNGVIDGDYLKIKNILIKYQLENGIIETEYDEESGYFGEKTYAAFRKTFGITGDDVFIAKYIESGALSELSLLEKAKIDSLKAKLELLLENKYKGDDVKIFKFKNSLKVSINETLNTINYPKKKSELIYFRDIL